MQKFEARVNTKATGAMIRTTTVWAEDEDEARREAKKAYRNQISWKACTLSILQVPA